ncbi:MAG TPA: AMP-binding protein [Tepidisphaeraceae bacterium]|jgi:acyl-CoA synthetase (AMP-forming)/AMP-acid ligase II/acyl carrier protein|nr:AMP-binding protein [Tepidisphaeraceae bacterium]
MSNALYSNNRSTFSDVLAAWNDARPDQTAYTFLNDGVHEEATLTFAQLLRRVRAIAAALQERGMQGRHAVLLYPSGLEFVCGMIACLCSGVVAVPAYPPRAGSARGNGRLSGILDDCGAAIILTTAKLLNTVRAFAPHTVPCLATDQIDDACAGAWRDPQCNPSDLACLQYTSGSTAAPKGVMLTHANLMHNSAAIYSAFGHDKPWSGVIWLPPYHDMGLIGGILQALYAGTSVVLMPPAAFLQRPVRWLAAIGKYRAATSGGPNFAYDLCVDSISPAERATLDLSCWNVAFNGAEPVDPRTLDRFADAFASCGFRREAFYPCYGLAESTLIVAGPPKGRPPVFADRTQENHAAPSRAMVSCGSAVRGQHIRIVDPHSRQECSPGATGEIWVSGGSVAQGYWNKPRQTADAFDGRLDTGEGPFLRTGDVGCLRDGELYISGRIKDLVIIRGIKHSPHDIERTAMESHPALQMAGGAAFSVPVASSEGLVIVQEVQRSQRNADAGQIIAAIRQAVSDEHDLSVHSIQLLRPGQMPRTSSGKIKRFACRDGFIARSFELVAEWSAPEPSSCGESQPPMVCSGEKPASVEAIEQWIRVTLAVALNTSPDEIDRDEPFARYGLDSAKGVAMAGQIAERFEIEAPATLFWDFPTTASLAEHLFCQVRPELVKGAA